MPKFIQNSSINNGLDSVYLGGYRNPDPSNNMFYRDKDTESAAHQNAYELGTHYCHPPFGGRCHEIEVFAGIKA